MFLQQPDAVRHLPERGFPGARLPVCVVKRLRPVDGNAHQPSVVVEEPAIVIGKQRAVGLDTIVYHMAVGILPLQVHRFLIEGKRAHQGLPAMPGEKHLTLRLTGDIILYEFT